MELSLAAGQRRSWLHTKSMLFSTSLSDVHKATLLFLAQGKTSLWLTVTFCGDAHTPQHCPGIEPGCDGQQASYQKHCIYQAQQDTKYLYMEIVQYCTREKASQRGRTDCREGKSWNRLELTRATNFLGVVCKIRGEAVTLIKATTTPTEVIRKRARKKLLRRE